MKGTVFNIQRFCLHDGPGIRTTVFLKGCPLRCRWCHNPAGLSPNIQVQFLEDKCVGCARCASTCKCHTLAGAEHILNRADCRKCFECIENCPSGALSMCGEVMTAEELFSAVMADKDFYETDGGVTFSGGEPLLQSDFVREVAELVRQAGYTVTVDTCGEVPWEAFQTVLPVTDLFLYDVKAMEPELHKSATGVDNLRIQENLRRLDGCNKDIWIRIPVIPTVNDTVEEMTKIAELLTTLSTVKRVTLMPYHSLGNHQYKALGYVYPFDASLSVSDEQIAAFTDIFRQHGLLVKQ
ncbi:MAG: glycyl-radical enzyme activating protein [Clostridia bacterium]|nr:glycyl-radical enzyme activating protein [Clostridia bacterium]